MRLGVVHGLPAGGALRWALDTTVRLAASNEVEVFEVAFSGRPAPTWPAGVPVHRSVVEAPRPLPGNLGMLEVLRPWWKAQHQVAAALDGGRFDVVLTHPCQVTQAPAVLLLTSRPTVYFMQEVRRRSYEAGYRDAPTGSWTRRRAAAMAIAAEDCWPRRIDRRAVRASTTVLANSAFTAESALRTYGREALPCLLGIDTGRFRLSPATAPRQGHLLLVGGLERNKGALWLIEAVGAMEGDRPPLVITGQRAYGPYVEEVRDTAHRFGVTLEIKEDVAEEELIALYQDAAATCCVARLEPFGLTTVESLACGTPVVGVAEGGFREVIHEGVNGVLVPRSVRALAVALRDVIDRNWDPAALRASVVPSFDIAGAVNRLEEHLVAVAG